MALHPPPRLWSEDDKQAVRAMLLEGMSCGGIAKVLSLTRSAVVGRIYRDPDLYGYARRVSPKPDKPKPQPQRRPHPALGPGRVPISPSRLKLMKDLEPLECRFGMAEDEQRRHLFCAAPARPGQPYCPGHMQLAYPRTL